MSSLICGIHHIGVVVSDLEAGRKFYEDVFDFTVIGVDDWDEGNTEVNKYVGMDESSAISYMMQGANTYLEIWQYLTPPTKVTPDDYQASDQGYRHVCFLVTDFDTVLERFLAAGGSLIKPLGSGRPGGAKIHYCRDPFGNIIELLEMSPKAGSRIHNLPGVAEEGVFAPAAEQYYALMDGEFVDMRDVKDLPK
jgi:catechol 2,3-dioxygenase-like lactoylglutathione lyase family enzyme